MKMNLIILKPTRKALTRFKNLHLNVLRISNILFTNSQKIVLWLAEGVQILSLFFLFCSNNFVSYQLQVLNPVLNVTE